MDKIKADIFLAKIEIIGINPFVYLPDTILNSLFIQANKSKGHIPIKGTINDNPYKQTLVKYSGEWRLYINTTMLKNSPKRIGEIYCPPPSFVHRLCKISLCFKGVASILMHNTWRRAV